MSSFICSLCKKSQKNSSALTQHTKQCMKTNRMIPSKTSNRPLQVNKSRYCTRNNNNHQYRSANITKINRQTTIPNSKNPSTSSSINYEDRSNPNIDDEDITFDADTYDTELNTNQKNEQDQSLQSNVHPPMDLSDISTHIRNQMNSMQTQTPIDTFGLQLYYILDKANNVPSYLYDEINKVIRNIIFHYQKNPNESNLQLPSRDQLISKYMKYIIPTQKHSLQFLHENEKDILSTKPITESIKLYNCDQQINVSRFSFTALINSLLNDQYLMQQRNTLYHKPEYYLANKYNSETYNDIHTGSRFKDLVSYYNSIQYENKEPIDTVVCGLIVFIDGVAPDANYKHSIEPFSFTLSIFNRATRNLPHAWRNLGYIPDPEKISSMNYQKFKNKEMVKMKRIHYHQILKYLLSDLIHIQKNTSGILWNLPYIKTEECNGNTVSKLIKRKVRLVFPILQIIGDALGNDKLCLRRAVYSFRKVSNLGACRDCNISFKNCSNPMAICQPITKMTLLQCSNDTDYEKLNYYNIPIQMNAFTDVFFGPNMSIYESTPVESLHQWSLGVLSVITTFLLTYLSPAAVEALDSGCIKIAKQYRQSDRSYSKLSIFMNGVSKCKLTGYERLEQLHVIYLSMCRNDTKSKIIEAESKYTNNQRKLKVNGEEVTLSPIMSTTNRYKVWVQLLERCITFSSFMSQDSMNIDYFKKIPLSKFSDKISFTKLKMNTKINYSCIVATQDDINNEYLHEDDDHSMETCDYVNTSSVNSQPDIRNDFDYYEKDIETEVQSDYMLSSFEFAIRCLMKQIYKVFNFSSATHLITTMKFHQMLHYERYILYYAVQQNFSGCRPEANGKDTAKCPWKGTKKTHDDSMYMHMCNKYMTRCVMKTIIHTGLSKNCFHRNNIFDNIIKHPDSDQRDELIKKEKARRFVEENNSNEQCEGKFVIEYSITRSSRNQTIRSFDTIKIFDKQQKTSSTTNDSFMSTIRSFLTKLNDNQLLPSVNGKIVCYRSYTKIKEDQLFRADYSYDGKPWFDWAICHWEECGDHPVNIRIIMDVKQTLDANNWSCSSSLCNNDYLMYVYGAEIQHHNSLGFKPSLGKIYVMNINSSYIIPSSSIENTVFVVQLNNQNEEDICNQNKKINLYHYYSASDMENKFIDNYVSVNT